MFVGAGKKKNAKKNMYRVDIFCLLEIFLLDGLVSQALQLNVH